MKDLRKNISYGKHRSDEGAHSMSDYTSERPIYKRDKEYGQDFIHPLTYDSGRCAERDENLYHESTYRRQPSDARSETIRGTTDAHRYIGC